MKKTNHNKAKLSVIALTLVACLAVAGVAAYFTDADTTTNTFTVGKVSLDLQEPNWVGDITGDSKDITPNQEIAKDPQIKNDGVNDEFVFTTVAVPYANIKTAAQDGTVNAEATNTELYTLLDADGAEGINDGWILMGYLNDNEEVSDTVVYRTDGTVVHLYAYGSETEMTALAKDATTAPVFSKVRFCNAVEDQALEGEEKEITINAYGIQTTNINDNVGAGNADGKVAPSDVWAVVHNANPSTAQAVAEDAVTDEKE